MLGATRLSRPASVASARRALRELLTSWQPDVVVTHGPWIHCIAGAAVKGARLPLAMFLHSPASLHALDLWARTVSPDLVLANSRFTLRQSQWWLRSTPGVVCTFPFRAPETVDRLEERRKLGIVGDVVVVIQVSRLEPGKGQRLFLGALKHLEHHRNWCALVVGGPQPGKEAYAQSLMRLRETLGLANRVHFLGHRTDVGRLLAAADVFCHPNSSPESFGIAFVEAMLAGLPVITTNMGGSLEIFAEGGGTLIPPEIESIAAALEELIGDRTKREAVGRRAREIAHSHYTDGNGVRMLGVQLAALLKAIAKAPPGDAWV